MTYTLAELAQLLGAELRGDSAVKINGIATLQEARSGQVSFLANASYKKYLAATAATAVVLPPELAADYQGNCLLLDNPYLGYAQLSQLFNNAPAASAVVHPSAVIAADAVIAEGVSIGANVVIEAGAEIASGSVIGAGCVIGRCAKLGKNSLLYANVTLYHDVVLGRDCILHSGAVIGADGFGFAPEAGSWTKIYQLGGVRLGDRVEVGAGTTIDRGALADTCVGSGVKIDNQVQIAHNVTIGDNSAIAGCTAIAGSARIGSGCTIAGGVGIVGHIEIADGCHVTAMSLVTKSITKRGSYSSGTPLSESKHWRKSAVRFGQLDQLVGRIRTLEQTVARLED